MKRIKLTQGKFAIVDDDDYEWLNSFKWCAIKNGDTFYAVRNFTVDGRRMIQSMRLFITGYNPEKLQIDHRYRNGLNNQRSNLRPCTPSENQMNSKPQRNSSSIYKGVSWNKLRCKWLSQIQVYGKKIYIGLFSDEKDAARAYDNVAIKHFGAFALLNFKILDYAEA